MRWRRSTRREVAQVGAARWALVVALVGLGLALLAPARARAAGAEPAITVFTDQLAGPSFMGLGVQFDPYDTLSSSQLGWPLISQRLDFMNPGLMRVVEPASDYFGGYDSSGNPTYRWTSPHVQELLAILGYAKSRGITVVLGDWGDPLIGGDARVPIDFIGLLRSVYGYTNIRYYNVMNEPNGNPSCAFACWTAVMKTVSVAIAKAGDQSWLTLVGPDDANSWDDTQVAQALDRTSGLESDNPLGGDSWVTATLETIPGIIGAYDSHRYATIWGVENGVYGDQVRARREEISNLDSPAKPYFAGEVGLTARQVTPITARSRATASLTSLLDPSSISAASTFVDSQPNIATYSYGVWMGDMMIQAIAAGLSGASAWDLDDAMHVGGGYGSQNLKQWGFWNSLAGQDGYPASDLAPRPWYYAWSVISRAFPAGAQTLVVPSTGVAGLRVAAARIPSDGARRPVDRARQRLRRPGVDRPIGAVDHPAPHPRAVRLLPRQPARRRQRATRARPDRRGAVRERHRPPDPGGRPRRPHLAWGGGARGPRRGNDDARRRPAQLASHLRAQPSPWARPPHPGRVQLRPLARHAHRQAQPVPRLPREPDDELRAKDLLPEDPARPRLRLRGRHRLDADRARLHRARAHGGGT